MKASFCLLLLIALISCREKSKQDLIIGNWKLALQPIDSTEYRYSDQPPPPPYYVPERGTSYTFLNDSIVNTRRVYFKTPRPKGRRGEIQFLGTNTKYKIIGDCLKFYNPIDSVWESGRMITSITTDTLILTRKDGQELVFYKYDYNLDEKPLFDKIALSSSGCYGSCPIINIIIDSTGHVVFYGEMYVDKIGFYEAQISRERFLEIEFEFRKADIGNLKNQYSASWTDDETISTTFCSRDTVIKSIEDYGRTGPDELVWAYPSLRYLFQKLDLKRIDSTKVPPYLNLHFFSFEKGDEISRLTQSESFLLWDYLRKGRIVQDSFNELFKLRFVPNYFWVPSYDEIENPKKQKKNVNSIVTDGRYYTFELVGQKSITIDIGFNYLVANKGLIHFRPKEVFE